MFGSGAHILNKCLVCNADFNRSRDLSLVLAAVSHVCLCGLILAPSPGGTFSIHVCLELHISVSSHMCSLAFGRNFSFCLCRRVSIQFLAQEVYFDKCIV